MSQPLVAIGRILVPYTVGGKTHTFHAYVKNPTNVGGNWVINSRVSDANDTNWGDAADRLALAIGKILPSTATWATCEFQVRTLVVWETKATRTLIAAVSASAAVLAVQTTMTLRDSDFKKVRAIVLEANQSVPLHIHGPAEGGADMDAFVSPFVVGTGNAADPFNWMVSRGERYLSVGPFVSVVCAYNRKLRRARGY